MIKNRENPKGAYGTHFHPLLASLLNTEGLVIELGTGDYSTPLIHEICKFQGRPVISYDDSVEWQQNFIDLQISSHNFILVKNWSAIDVIPCGVVLIDHYPPEQRVVDIKRFRDVAQILVVHDTDKMNYYGYGSVFSEFKYCHKYERYLKSTTLLSNHIDVTKLC
jgi:hypothetical protein